MRANVDDAIEITPFNYGRFPTLLNLGDRVQGHFALEDEHFTPAQVDVLESRLKEGKVNYAFFRYQAQHAFGNEAGERYDPEATKLAWQRSLDFLEKHLK